METEEQFFFYLLPRLLMAVVPEVGRLQQGDMGHRNCRFVGYIS